MSHPALEAFVAALGRELVVAQVLVRRLAPGYELRHLADRQRAADELRLLPVEALRTLAQFTAAGAFRPLKSAPDLQTGWRARAQTDQELGVALGHLYPGALADWLAAQSEPPPVTSYRQFTARQSGIYAVCNQLHDAQAARVVAACCGPAFCLKRRLWTVGTLEPDLPPAKSLIPCLEPCAVLLELARVAAELEQEPRIHLELAAGEMATLQAALRIAQQHPDPGARAADFSDPANPRRLQWLREKLAADWRLTIRDSRAEGEVES